MVSRIMTYDSEPSVSYPSWAGPVSTKASLFLPQSHESVHSGGVPASDSLDHLISKGWRTMVCR